MPVALVATPALRAGGIAGTPGGLALTGWAAIRFRRKRTPIVPHPAPGVLIVEGPYRIGRNPIHLGMVPVLAGQVIWLGALSPLLLPPVLRAVLARRLVSPEEAGPVAAFGVEGRAHLARTRAWL